MNGMVWPAAVALQRAAWKVVVWFARVQHRLQAAAS
jgi:hypothetical protein